MGYELTEAETEVFHQIIEERDAWDQAITDGIGDVPVSKLERAAISMFVATVATDEPGEEHPAETAARRVVTEPLIRKMVVALFLEYGVNSHAIPDGILGRHLDQAIDQLLPYAKNSELLGPVGVELFED